MKVKKGHIKYRKLLAELDALGVIVDIRRVDKKQYNFILNGVIVKNYKKRESCNKLLIKIHEYHKTQNNNCQHLEKHLIVLKHLAIVEIVRIRCAKCKMWLSEEYAET